MPLHAAGTAHWPAAQSPPHTTLPLLLNSAQECVPPHVTCATPLTAPIALPACPQHSVVPTPPTAFTTAQLCRMPAHAHAALVCVGTSI